MSWPEIYNAIRAFYIVYVMGSFLSFFIAIILSGLIKHYFKLDEDTVLMYVGLPVFIILEITMIPKFKKSLKSTGYI